MPVSTSFSASTNTSEYAYLTSPSNRILLFSMFAVSHKSVHVIECAYLSKLNSNKDNLIKSMEWKKVMKGRKHLSLTPFLSKLFLYSQPGQETDPFETTFQPNLPSAHEIEYAQPAGTSFDLEESESSISTSTETTQENSRSTETAIAAIGFVAAFILILIVFAGVALNLCRYRIVLVRSTETNL